ncbi:conserved hypothetical protein [Chloroherpeton thalassium ATCC 35110]|uniref:DUF2721 domain-containing protein n=1 Tax=Chloroherpeton thalassium (strain ATCC 35110 / GB-78) TaxID=517418 RepID=B3QX44_CHLT3|nr:DUF2721 domain-containing protein [Chloroherpeton thalassium]ACF14854.1 conserved hypothetical protein [Chloroherpeton thalassium ATCC 35110]
MDFSHILQSAVTPLVLISGVGLLLLSITNRYSHALDRTRNLNTELKNAPSAKRKENLKKQLDSLYRRCKILKKSIGFVVLSILLSSLIIIIKILESLLFTALDMLNIALLISSMFCIVISSALLFIDVSLSLHALDVELEDSDFKA